MRSGDLGGWGLIPASAGSTRCVRGRGSSAGAHPRVRGEHDAVVGGKSPSLGLIPASAGSTLPEVELMITEGAHPRVRGEHRVVCVSDSFGGGSSPRPRGARCT